MEQFTENVPDSCQTRSCHESETFNVGDKTLRERTVRPVVNHDDSSHEQTMLNEVNMDFRIPGLPHSVVKHAQSTSVRELIQKRSAKHAYHIGVKTSSIAHAGISYKKQWPIEVSLNTHWTFSQFQNTSSRREDLTATDTGNFQKTKKLPGP